MIHIKSKREIDLMRIAGNIVAQTHEYLKPFIKPGITTKELDDRAYDYIMSAGATPSFKGYNGFTGSICASINEVVVHGIPSKKVILKEGDLIAIDIGACYKGYHGDSAWTYAVGKIDLESQKLMEVTKEALYRGLEQVKPGNRVFDIANAIEEFVQEFGYGIVEEFTGHGIGKDLHEDPFIPNFKTNDEDALLKEGMVICIEPMINIGTKKVKILKDNWTTVTLDKKRSAHYEHMVAVTETGYEILTELAKKGAVNGKRRFNRG